MCMYICNASEQDAREKNTTCAISISSTDTDFSSNTKQEKILNLTCKLSNDSFWAQTCINNGERDMLKSFGHLV